jgi:hypothetical protein
MKTLVRRLLAVAAVEVMLVVLATLIEALREYKRRARRNEIRDNQRGDDEHEMFGEPYGNVS